MFGVDPITSTIRQVAKFLLDDADVQKVEEQRLEYTRALCAAAAYSMPDRYRISERLTSNNKTEGCLHARSEDILARAAAVRNIHKLHIRLSQRVDPNIRSEYFGFALQNAARLGRRDIVSLLLEYNHDKPHGCASPGEAAVAALEAACEAGQTQIVDWMLDSSYKIHFLQTHYEAAVDAAAYNGPVDIMWLLLNRDNFPNKENVMAEALFGASSHGYVHVIQTLLDSGLDVNKRNHEGRNSLHRAAVGGHARVVRLLLNRGV